MAFNSVSLRKAQVSLSCHFCNKQGVRWKCEECDVFLCTSCKGNIHQRLKSAQDHDVVSISEICRDKPSRREVSSLVISSVFKSYITTMPAITSLLCSGNDLIYFIDQNARLVKGQLQESSIKTLQTLDKKIFDIAVNKEGDILFKEMISNNVVCSLTHKGKIRTVVDTSPMRPLSLHINKDNELIVGLREHGPAFPVTEFSVRQVIIFDSDYKRKVLLETDKKGKKLFCYPARITTDSKNVLYVADWMDEYHGGRIVAVDVNGRLKFTYNGDLYLETFLPHGIAITPSDNIILSDEKSNSLHILNSRGELLGLHFIEKEYNIEKPHSLCIDSEGYLLIGRGLIKGSDAKIYMVKIAEHFMIL